MIAATVHVVVLHSNGRSVWLAPWLADTLIVVVVAWLLLRLLAWLLKDR